MLKKTKPATGLTAGPERRHDGRAFPPLDVERLDA
jgi:hypothetical protein